MRLRRISLYFHTLRYLKPRQIWGRLVFKLHRPRPDLRSAPPRRDFSPVIAQQASFPSAENGWVLPARRRPSLVARDRFQFLNEEGVVADGTAWNNPAKSKLWLYNLHYFDDLNALDAPSRLEWHRELIARWVAENPPGLGVGWEPYPLSLRIVNWIKWVLAETMIKPELPMVVLKSLAVQTRFLAKRMEFHLLGNHLFANFKALVFSGLFFQGAEGDFWLAKGLAGIEIELNEQILPDGGHFERSPMYHALFLEDILDIINLMRIYQSAWSDRFGAMFQLLEEKAGQMLEWLSCMTHPDRAIVLFNDASLDVAPSIEQLTAYGEALSISSPSPASVPLTHLQDTGYIRVQVASYTAFLDTAPIGPDYLPGHGHADTLSFELSCEGHRFIVDSGTSCYGTSVERVRQRSTSAHNTIEIDGKNSSEIWGRFRVAQRAYPQNLEVENTKGEIVVRCSHDGYRWLHGKPTHLREWRFSKHRFIVKDEIRGKFSKAVSRFHFHPDVQVKCTNTHKGSAILPGGKVIKWSVEGGIPACVASTYHPEFGKSFTNQCLEVVLNCMSSSIEFSLFSFEY